MTIWKDIAPKVQRPAYRSLADLITEAIDKGGLQIGDKLPTHRDLAYQLGLSVQTISRAYEELVRRGLIDGQVGRGTYVSASPVESNSPWVHGRTGNDLIDFSILKPVSARLHMDKTKEAFAALSENLSDTAIFSFRPSNALRPYMETALTWLELCGLRCAPEAIVMTNGSTSAMTTALMTAASAGDLVLTESLCLHTLIPLARYLNLRLEGVTLDREGIDPDALERLCRAKKVTALFLMPSGLNPAALMMGLERREAIAALARKYDFTLIENDAWGPLQPGRPQPVAALAPERSFYFTSFTKCLAPGLRHGYLVVPDLLVSAASNRHLVTDWVATPLIAEIVSRWISDGTAQELLAWQMDALGQRNTTVATALEGIDFNASPNGMHIWLPLPEGFREAAFVASARQFGVAVAPGSAFTIGNQAEHHGVRLCIGGMSQSDLLQGLQIIARLYKSPPEPALLAF